MKNKDEIKGKGKQIKGAIEAKVGELINDPDLKAKGEAERVEGKVQEKTGTVRRKVGETVKKVGKAIAGGLLGLTLLGVSASLSGCDATSNKGMGSPTPQAQVVSNTDVEEKIK